MTASGVAHTDSEILLEIVESELHDLCQPLTTLRCRLELAQLSNDPGEMVEAVREALEDTQRLLTCVTRMRQRLIAQIAGDAPGPVR